VGARSSLSRVRGPVDPSATLDYATRQYVDTTADTFIPIANGTHFNGNGGATVTSLPQGRLFETRKLLRVIAGGANMLQIEWANIWTSNQVQSADATCEMAGPNSVSVRMGIEYPAGNMRMTSGSSAWSAATAYAIRDQVTSGGSSWVAIAASTNQTPADGSAYWQRVRRYLVRWDGDDGAGTVTFAAGDYKQSLPLPLQEVTLAGDLIAVLGTYDTGSTTNRVPYAGMAGASNTAPFVDWVILNTTAMPAAGSALADTGITTQTNGNTTTANSTTVSSWMKIPYATAITGNTPVKRCVALFGDSLIQGAGGDIRDGEPGGFFVRSVDNASWWRIAQGGNQAGCYTKTNAPWQYACATRCTAIVTDLLLNDIQGGNDLATTKTRMTRLWNALASLGPPVYAGYPTPISLSSDSWATTTNQSRWTTGGTSAFPGDDATYLTSVYGGVAMWMSQDGAGITVDGSTVQIGQTNHPLQGLLDWRTLLADPSTSWKWNPGYTTDGAHPNATAVTVQTAYLRPQMDVVLGAEQTPPMAAPAPSGAASAPIQNMDRSLASIAGPGSGSGSIMTYVGVSPGRLFYGARVFNVTASNKSWTLFIGADPAKLKAVANGTVTGPPAANSIMTLGLSTPLWIPSGYLMYLQLTIPAISAWGGLSALAATLNRNGLNFAIAGNSADTGVVTTGTVVNATAASKWSLVTFRVWAEMF
jgi:hypothetical protein